MADLGTTFIEAEEASSIRQDFLSSRMTVDIHISLYNCVTQKVFFSIPKQSKKI